MNLKTLVRRCYPILARSSWLTGAAIITRNQMNLLVADSMHSGFDLQKNGEFLLLERIAQEDGLFIDCGANQGEWSAEYVRLNPGAKGLAIEPSRRAFETLSSRLAEEDGVRTIPIALGAQEDRIQFFEQSSGDGQCSSFFVANVDDQHNSYEVVVRTLDSLLAELGICQVNMLKVDTEGYDFNVLRGAAAIIDRQGIGVIQFEYNRSWMYGGSTLHAAAEFLQDRRYDLFVLKGDGLHPLDLERFGEWFGYSNMVALSPAYRSLVDSIIRN